MLSQHERELLNKSHFDGIKKGMNAKVEFRDNNAQKVKETKAAISKKNTELEKKLQDCELLITRLKKAVHSEKAEKTKFKRYYENELAKEKSAEFQKSTNNLGMIGKLNLQPVLAQ